MTAAVSDYRPAGNFQVIAKEKLANGDERWTVRNIQAAKVKSDYDEIAVLGQRTEKLVDLFRTAWGYSGLLVKFKLQVGIGRDELIAIGQASRRASGADYLVANTLEMVEGEQAGAYLLSDGGAEWVARAAHSRRVWLKSFARNSPKVDPPYLTQRWTHSSTMSAQVARLAVSDSEGRRDPRGGAAFGV